MLRATTACNFSSLIWPAGSAPVALASLLSTLRSHISLEKHSVSRLSYLFAHLDLLSSETFSFSRERLRRVLRKKAAVVIHLQIYVFTPSHLQIYIFTPSHLLIYIFTPSHLLIYIFTPSHLLQIYIFTPSDLHLHTFTSADLHLHTFTSADLLSLFFLSFS